MPATLKRLSWLILYISFCFITVAGQTNEQKAPSPAKKVAAPAASVDLAKQPTLYAVGYAHLDTEWRWEYPQTIQEYLSKTMRNNFALVR